MLGGLVRTYPAWAQLIMYVIVHQLTGSTSIHVSMKYHFMVVAMQECSRLSAKSISCLAVTDNCAQNTHVIKVPYYCSTTRQAKI